MQCKLLFFIKCVTVISVMFSSVNTFMSCLLWTGFTCHTLILICLFFMCLYWWKPLNVPYLWWNVVNEVTFCCLWRSLGRLSLSKAFFTQHFVQFSDNLPCFFTRKKAHEAIQRCQRLFLLLLCTTFCDDTKFLQINQTNLKEPFLVFRVLLPDSGGWRRWLSCSKTEFYSVWQDILTLNK